MIYLPPEIWVNIFHYLDDYEKYKLRFVNKYFNNIIKNNYNYDTLKKEYYRNYNEKYEIFIQILNKYNNECYNIEVIRWNIIKIIIFIISLVIIVPCYVYYNEYETAPETSILITTLFSLGIILLIVLVIRSCYVLNKISKVYKDLIRIKL